ncbi:MAG: hypothetical protein GY856_09195 [bacterium]|nr:hypothetical protein [bacterium]
MKTAGERIGAVLRWIARGRSAWEGALVVVLATVQLCAWIAPSPEPSRLLSGVWWHPGLLLRALVVRISDAVFLVLGPLALIGPLVAIWLLRHPTRVRIAPRLLGLWLGVAILLELAGGLPSRLHGGLPGAGVVALLGYLPGPPAVAWLVAGLVGLALILWSLRLGGPIWRIGRRAGAFAAAFGGSRIVALTEWLATRKQEAAAARAEPTAIPRGTVIEGAGDAGERVAGDTAVESAPKDAAKR